MNKLRIKERAGYMVRRAIRRGELRPPKEKGCVDCGGQATTYDHRDYSKPLDVDPVCMGCNIRRGPGAMPDSVEQMEGNDTVMPYKSSDESAWIRYYETCGYPKYHKRGAA